MAAHLVKGVATLWDNMGFLSRQSEAETKRLETDGAILVFVTTAVGDDGNGGHGCWVGVVVAGGGSRRRGVR